MNSNQLTLPAAAAKVLQEPLLQHGRKTMPTRPPVARMAHILQALSSGRPCNSRRLAEDLECCQRTIKRDLRFMQDRLLLPIEYDAQRWTFRLAA